MYTLPGPASVALLNRYHIQVVVAGVVVTKALFRGMLEKHVICCMTGSC